MGTRTRVVYGPGGYDPTKPNNNVVDSGNYTMPDPPADLPPALAAIRNAVTGQGVQPTTDQLALACARVLWRVLVQGNDMM